MNGKALAFENVRLAVTFTVSNPAVLLFNHDYPSQEMFSSCDLEL